MHREEAHRWLAGALGVPSPFPWQAALLDRLLNGDPPSGLDIPTGLGKTAVVAIWLVARAAGARVPRRLVYVVDRRAVVDQATDVAEALRAFVETHPALRSALGLEPGRTLPISTLRGQFLDNREWLVDPSAPAIVLGTVDMVGSRLLFEGYGVSRRMRPYHAGLLGSDTFVVVDEAHIIPSFERLLRTIEQGAAAGLGPRRGERDGLVPRMRVLALSATGRADGLALTLTNVDRSHPIVARRLAAEKLLVLRPDVAARDLPQRLAEEAWALSGAGTQIGRCIVFCDRRDDAQAVADWLKKRAEKAIELDIELLVGGRRVWERAAAAAWLRERGFLAATRAVPPRAAFLIATSAGEVGVDLDADHMVSDLVTWERMVQRFGRVNRRGDGAARVVVIPAINEDAGVDRSSAVKEIIASLPRTEQGVDVSPGALSALKERASSDEHVRELVAQASTPEPLYPPLTRPLVEAWSMTSLEEHTGRPADLTPWLRGWIDEPDAQTTLIFRDILPVTRDERLFTGADLEAFLDAAGPHLAEQLETETWRVLAWLGRRCEAVTAAALFRVDDVVAVLMSRARRASIVTCRDLSTKELRAELERRLAGATLVVDARIGGLDHGLLYADSTSATDVTSLPAAEGGLPFRVRHVGQLAADAERSASWRRELQIPFAWSDAGDEIEWIVIESRAAELPESEEGRSVSVRRAQKLDEHEEWTERAARRLADRLALPSEYSELLALAARLHDEGKRARRWQQAFRAPTDGVYGKTLARPNLQILGGYRHELGSLPYAEHDTRVRALDADLRELCLHLIAAHHGNARPLLRTEGGEEPPSKLEARAQEVAVRFARLERDWGPWGLAWWEALLRAADQEASRLNDEGGANG